MKPSQALIDAYIEAALWSSYYADEEGDLVHFSDSEYHLSDEARETMTAHCQEWFDLCEVKGLPPVPEYSCPQYSDDVKSGHDLWLTRNGHGVGYWDRGLGELGNQLSDLARSMGECNLYLGDDQQIYIE